MKYVKRMKLNAAEVAQIRRNSNGYIWVAVDVKEGVIAAGDEYLVDLRDSLLYKYHSNASNVYGLGLNLRTGEIYYAPAMNRLNKAFRNLRVIPASVRDRIDTLLAYFFEDFKPFRATSQRTYEARSLPTSSC